MFVGCFPFSILLTWLYNSTNGSLLICILFHNAVNTSAAYFYGNLQGPELRPLEIFILLLIVAASFVVIRTKGTLRTYKQPIDDRFAIAEKTFYETKTNE